MTEKDFEKIFKALANKRRLSILQFLKKRKSATVGTIAGQIKLSFKSTSKHLNLLFAADLVEREQKNLQQFYSLSNSVPNFVKNILSVL